ncbi:MAG TPA: nucleotidyltransferase domain-containing protein, partial [Planctomycetota bacterium]|nr:nucleotidyltransferase domain-containing protein [Planctomycetota bacterium]
MVVVFETVHGSRAYGLASATSDVDKKGVFVPDARVLHGFTPGPEQVEPEKERVLYDVRKFFALAEACNPTVIEILFTDPADHVSVTEEGRLLLEARGMFLSRRARDSFGRYAFSQLKRIRTHRRWLLEPPAKKPERKDFGLPESEPLIPKEQRGAAEAMLEKGTIAALDIPPNFLDALAREKQFAAAFTEWEQYQSWLKNRNPDRAELERKFGYDAKHASHLIRLLRMAAEILERGEVIVKRPDAEELRAVRAGALSYDALVAEAERMEARLDGLAKASALPERPDHDALDALCATIVERTIHP